MTPPVFGVFGWIDSDLRSTLLRSDRLVRPDAGDPRPHAWVRVVDTTGREAHVSVVHRWAIKKRWPVLVVIAAIPMVFFGLSGATTGSASGNGPISVQSATTKIGHVAAGRIVNAATSNKPFVPTNAQKAARGRAMNFLAGLRKAPIGPHTNAANVKPLAGPQTSLTSQQSPGSFKVYKDSRIPASCTTSCAQSSINEPDTANAGATIEQTSNWNIAYTTNGGASSPTWKYQNPYSLDSFFCCDQTVTYVPSRDRFIYEGLDLGTGNQSGFDIGLTKSKQPTSWCIYHFSGSSFGGTDGDALDYPKIAYANNNVYVTWNEYNTSGTWLYTGLARFPVDSLATCGGLSYSYLTRTDNFTFGLTIGNSSLDTFYFVSNWYTSSGGSGTSERIYSWPENSGSYNYSDVGVSSYNFSGGSCASSDGVVTNWCSRLDPRVETAWISRAEYNAQANSAFSGDTILGVSITAGPGGGDPFPYVIYEYFKLNSLSYVQTSATFNDGYAFAYSGCAPDVYGYVGCVMSWGGGTGTTHYYPGGLILLQDNLNPTAPFAYDFNLYGSGNASAWGDYMISQPFEPDVGPFITTEWAVNGSGSVVPHVVIWGRGRDSGGYKRWKNS